MEFLPPQVQFKSRFLTSLVSMNEPSKILKSRV